MCNEKQLRAVFERTVSSANYRTLVDILAAGPKTRGKERAIFTFKDGTSGDVYKCILRALASDPVRQTFARDEISRRVAALCVELKPMGSAITGSART